MTAPLRGTPRLSGIPASQNTAPVAEFRCLFTHDTRKKQKKWQDGYLKFHSFNSRVIVYDASRFTVGDTYYKDSNELHEGDELMLDKGVMVEVAEPVGVTQTDLTPLFERKTKDSPQRNNPAGPPRPLPRPTLPASNPLRAVSQPRHKSLNALLGTSRGPIGKAAPIKSPFEERMEKENHPVEERAPKRQKTAHERQEQQAPSRPAPRETSSKTVSSLSARLMHSNTIPRPQAVQIIPRGATVISLSSQPETDNIPSDVTLPHTPARPQSGVCPPTNSFPPVQRESPPQPIAPRTPNIPKRRVPISSVKAQQKPQPRAPPSSPPVSASNRIENVDFTIEPVSDPPREPSPIPSPPKPWPVEKRKTKALKLSTGAKRGMLLCQSAPIRRRPSPDELDPQTSTAVRNGENALPQRVMFGEGSRRESIAIQDAMGKASHSRMDVWTTVGPSREATKSVEGTVQSPLETLDDLELAHGFLDQQLLVTPSSPHLHFRSTASKSPATAKPKITKRASTKLPKSTKRACETPTEGPIPKLSKAKATQPKDPAARPAKRKKADKAEPPAISRSSSPAAVCIRKEPPLSNPRAVLSEPHERSRTTSISLSPGKLAALSTGGFKKKPKRTKALLTASDNLDPAPPLRPVTVALPPHPLRSSKNGPLMSTTELSALLQNGPKSMRPEDDPIDDSTQGDSNVLPSKRSSGFHRSRSENDAPIPSTSDEWEQKSLPKPSDTTKFASASGSRNAKPKAGGLAALVKKTDPRRKFQRTQSLNVDTPLANAGLETPEVVSPPPVDTDVGPWSSEAFDLFDWKPPGKEWKAEGGKMRLVDVADEEDSGVGMLIDAR
ncbi:uncharacterized protein CC84DRAFT_1264228 [Paraphaeosphaeria sporulosa]|uniref:5'-3' DNA helicase ZGRF1-like N-terminal domain-containing protein n=1 Tax=Paraphaeosphaeria sporulosa TaxID=1460663 RepID=A0A177BV75_9PLEO|nr:uncharacterized protein CC84DRAFT_1264228 [Paraphaeosphaeria sporulosa]OAF99214.1 hypothetical protein CC84DRAFT_1264228 [Paraphaeosphaeria sporulosa]